jgi:hypothetical protein
MLLGLEIAFGICMFKASTELFDLILFNLNQPKRKPYIPATPAEIALRNQKELEARENEEKEQVYALEKMNRNFVTELDWHIQKAKQRGQDERVEHFEKLRQRHISNLVR